MTALAPVPFGPRALLIPTRDAAEATALADRLRASLPGAAAVVPGAESVTVTAAPGVPMSTLRARVQTLPATVDTPGRAPQRVTLPVRYDGADLSEVAALLGVSVAEVITRHTDPTYTVSFLGFAPGFPYLTGLDPFLAQVPRLDTPRTRIPAGSVGLAAGQTCVYPTASPGGWRLLGATDVNLFDPARAEDPALLAPGDTVRFEAVA